jgi:prepilin-type N-terminal cleavage/methylation domain-containing protein
LERKVHTSHRPGESETLRARYRCSAFTLIELLVVIAIIAMVAAILFPVFRPVAGKGEAGGLSVKQRQIGISHAMYAQDYDEAFRPVQWRVSVPLWRSTSPEFQGLLEPYIKNRRSG